MYNPDGKYMVKLWFNGCARKVVVADRLPVGRGRRGPSLICSFSTKRRELWVSIIEKAYMKVNRGYDFPGSKSGIALYALTRRWSAAQCTACSSSLATPPLVSTAQSAISGSRISFSVIWMSGSSPPRYLR